MTRASLGSPADGVEWERLAHAVMDAESAVERYEETAHREFITETANRLWTVAHNARQALIAYCTPGRILGLIAAARRGAEDTGLMRPERAVAPAVDPSRSTPDEAEP